MRERPPARQLAGVVRVSTFLAQSGHIAALVAAANLNACDARAASGCLSADVCAETGERDTVLVVSRWESESAVRAFLAWHEQRAHDTVLPHVAVKPRSVHYPAVPPPTPTA